jgi:CDP-glycerol glycerophosphotransferase (TagB/SpsB family)
VAPYDHYFVWSQLMKDEMEQFYPEVPNDRVHIVGTPQFDPYNDPQITMSRDEFFRWLGADPSRPVICFSGSDTSTAPDDQFYVEIVMEEIRAGHIKRNPQVVLRPAPVDSGKRFEKVRQKFPELIYKAPDWVPSRNGSWTGIIPVPADVKALTNLTLHCDLNLNVSSTMTLDFALRDKPVVNIAFDVTQPPPFGVPIWDFHFRFEHYVPVVQLGAARFAKSREELVHHINAYLEDPSLDREARKKFADLEVGVPVGQASARVVETLKRISR